MNEDQEDGAVKNAADRVGGPVLVSEIMVASPPTVRSNASIRNAWRMMRKLQIGHLPVLNVHGGVVGIISASRFDPSLSSSRVMPGLRSISSGSLDSSVATVVRGTPVSVGPDEDVDEVVDLLVENKLGALPVVGPEGQMVGIVSRLDVLRGLL
jgi:CBS domain-containing protein